MSAGPQVGPVGAGVTRPKPAQTRHHFPGSLVGIRGGRWVPENSQVEDLSFGDESLSFEETEAR
jgi:hypothetical protein